MDDIIKIKKILKDNHDFNDEDMDNIISRVKCESFLMNSDTILMEFYKKHGVEKWCFITYEFKVFDRGDVIFINKIS
jgi:hypothetical protein